MILSIKRELLLLGLDIQRPALYFNERTADILAKDTQRHESQAADEENEAQK